MNSFGNPLARRMGNKNKPEIVVLKLERIMFEVISRAN